MNPKISLSHLFLEPGVLRLIFVHCCYEDLPALTLVCKSFYEALDEKALLQFWEGKNTVKLWECVLEGSIFTELRMWDRRHIEQLSMSGGRIETNALPVTTISKGSVLPELERTSVVGVGEFISTPQGCGLVSSANGVWLREVDWVTKFESKLKLWKCLKSVDVPVFSANKDFVANFRRFSEDCCFFGRVHPTEEGVVQMEDEKYRVKRLYLAEYSLWCCKFPTSGISIVGVNSEAKYFGSAETDLAPILDTKEKRSCVVS